MYILPLHLLSFCVMRSEQNASIHMTQPLTLKRLRQTRRWCSTIGKTTQSNVLSMCSECVFLWQRSRSGWKSKEKSEKQAVVSLHNTVCGQGLVAVKLHMKNKQRTCMKMFGYMCLRASTVTLVSFLIYSHVNVASC